MHSRPLFIAVSLSTDVRGTEGGSQGFTLAVRGEGGGGQHRGHRGGESCE